MIAAQDQINDCLAKRQSFLVDAGAGAGKTYSLVAALREVLAKNRVVLAANGQRIACITFTNVAKDEILDRIGHDEVVQVTTIHDFLWATIQNHQRALKSALIKHNDQLPADSRRKKDSTELQDALGNTPVTYSDRGANFLKGRLHHDDLLNVARIVYEDNPMLSKLTSAKYPFLFVDEYQDTSKAVIDIILNRLVPGSVTGFMVGFFGDKLQNIYHSGDNAGIGEIPAALTAGLQSIKKEENRRCSKAVIEVLNRIRTDIKQYPAADNAEGQAVYIHPGKAGADGLAKAQEHLSATLGWSLAPQTTKELYLTHRLIAGKAGYAELLAAYQARAPFYREAFLKGDDPTISFFVQKVEPLLVHMAQGSEAKVIAALRDSGFVLDSNAAKGRAKRAVQKLEALSRTGSVKDVLDHIRNERLFPIPDEEARRLDATAREVDASDPDAVDREQREQEFYQAFFGFPYSAISAYAKFLNDHTPYATKHGVKGAEFDTVVVVLDDGGARWNIYSFSKYLSDEDLAGNPERWRRSRNVFYVCCSRPRKNLAVIDLTTRSAAKDAKVRLLFGQTNAVFL